MTILFTVDALDANNVEETLRFSDGKYIDGSANPYHPYIADAPIISVIANDGGLFDIFSERSIGDISLHNIDGSLNYLVDYAVDGRTAIVSWFDGATVTQRFIGTVGGMNDANNQVIFSLKAIQEALNIKRPMEVYAGTNLLPAGIEGTDDTTKGNDKPKVWGDCRNISAVLVNSSLQIYQVSSRDDCRITAVYDEGVLLAHNQVHGLHGVGAVSIAVDSHGIDTVDIAAGAKIMFSNHKTIYTVKTGLIAGVIVLASGLTSSVPNHAYIEVVNFYADAAALQYTDYFADGDHSKGDAIIAVVSGLEAINVGDHIIFGNHLVVYTVEVGLSDGVIVIEKGLLENINDGDIVQVVGVKSPVFWGGFQGYFRLTAKPFGTVTCDA